MIVESNYVIAIATDSRQFSTNEKQNQKQSHLVRAIFPALWAIYR